MSAAVTAAPEHESVFRPAAVLMCGRMLAFAATFYIPVVLARVFDPAQFGTYKQLFLIQLTFFYIGQLGMATSLYYFIPQSPQQAGRYIANALVTLGAAGLCGFLLVAGGATQLSQWMGNPELARHMFWLGLFLFLMLVAAPLEMVLIARHRHLAASAAYALSDVLRAAALIVPAVLLHSVDAVVKGAVAMASLRVLATLIYLRKDFGHTLRPDAAVLRQQLAYALPFAAAVVVEIVQSNLPAYVVSHLTNPATFAIFAVGCLQIPLVDFAASPTSDVMMVQMQEKLSQGRRREVVAIWHDTTWKLALFLFALAALLMTVAPETIVLLFTRKYLASVRIFAVWTLLIPLAAFQVDGVLRVFAQTRLILILNVVRLAIIAGSMKWSLQQFGLAGPAMAIVLATLVFKTAAIVRIRSLLEARFWDVLQWGRLAALGGVTAASAAATYAFKACVSLSGFAAIAAASALFAVVYGLLLWHLGLLTEPEVRMIERLRIRMRSWNPVRKSEVCA
jgi:O-antigen/teichoic acid export membrane protein